MTVACGAQAAKDSSALADEALVHKIEGVALLASANAKMESAPLVITEEYDSAKQGSVLAAPFREIRQAYDTQWGE